LCNSCCFVIEDIMVNGNGKMNFEMIGVIFAIVIALASAIGGYAVAKNNIETNKESINKNVETCTALIDKTQTNKEDIKVINTKLDNIGLQQTELKTTLDKQNDKLELILRKLQ